MVRSIKRVYHFWSMQERKYMRIFLLVPAVVILYFIFQIFQPFLLPITLAVIVVSLCYPVFESISQRLHERENWAALLMCLGITGVIIVPLVVFLILLGGEVSQIYQQVQAKIEGGELEKLQELGEHPYLEPVMDWIGPYLDLENIDVMKNLAATVQQISLFLLRQSTALLSGLFQTITGFLIMIVTMFFLFRDGGRLMNELRALTPLSERYERLLVDKFREVTTATVLGSLLTALAQGIAGGLVFLLLGLPNALFWGFLTALFSLVPVVGTSVVWVPWSIYLFATGSVLRAVILIVLAVGFVGIIDNFLRPIFIQGRTKMNTLLVFFAIMGGISYFGILGMIFGPILVALGLTLLELYKTEFREELMKPTEE